jgi:hypothetical protein
MKNKVKICRIAAFIGIAMVAAAYILLSCIANDESALAAMPAWTPRAIQLLLGFGSAFTVMGVLLGLYFKWRDPDRGRSLK